MALDFKPYLEEYIPHEILNKYYTKNKVIRDNILLFTKYNINITDPKELKDIKKKETNYNYIIYEDIQTKKIHPISTYLYINNKYYRKAVEYQNIANIRLDKVSKDRKIFYTYKDTLEYLNNLTCTNEDVCLLKKLIFSFFKDKKGIIVTGGR